MNVNTLNRNFALPISVVLIISLLIWGLGLPTWIKYAYAAQLTNVKDTLSDSDLSAAANHIISYTAANAVEAAETIKIQLDPTTSLFTQAFSSATTTDITVTGMTLVDVCGGGGDEVTAIGNYNGGSDENLTFTVCAGDTVSAGAKTITVGNGLWTNPGVAASYIIRISSGATPIDKADTRVAIIDDVVVTASVATNFTFTISGVNSGQVAANDEGTTDVTTTATSIPWGELAADVAKKARQDLSVSTNAKNGFTVTIWQDQNLTSASGADIDIFKNGVDGSPAVWTSPSATLDLENTYGHEGITSSDSSLSGGDTFGSALYDAIGTSNSPLEIFYHTGPARGTTLGTGEAQIGFKIEISTLQEAADDYTQALTYVATPTF